MKVVLKSAFRKGSSLFNLRLVFATLAVLIVCTALLAGKRTRPMSAAHPVNADNEEAGVITSPSQSTERLQAEVITIHPHGFEPQVIRRTTGRFLIAIDNRSGIQELSIRLDRLAGSRLKQVDLLRRKLKWRELIDLVPGDYKVTVAERPEWRCDITIGPR